MKKTLLSIMILFLLGINLAAQQGGYALEFGGTKYVNCGNDASVSISGTEISVEAWVYPTAFLTNYWDNVIVNKLHSSSHGYNLRCGGNGIVEFYVSYNTTDYGVATSSEGAIELNKWTHLAGTYDGANVKLYINGKLTVTTAYTKSIPAQDMPLIIGNHGNTLWLDRPFIGKIDEVRIWNITRTEEQIKANMYKEIGTDDHLKAYYKMSDGSGTSLTDNSGNNNTGTLTNGPEWKISGCFAGSRQALDFGGTDDYLTIPANASLNNNQFTVEFWMKFDGTQSAYNGIIDKGRDVSGQPDWFFLTIPTSTAVGAMFGYNGIELYFGLSASGWHHVAGLYNGSQLQLYLDGVRIYSNAVTYTPMNNEIVMGRRTSGSSYLNGQLDEVRIWSTARTESEIRENMFKTLAGNETGLAAYYRMDQYDGTTMYDLSSNANNGTLYNMSSSAWVGSVSFNTWLGDESTDWSTAANWSNGVPVSAQSAGIYNWNTALPNVTTLPILPATIDVNNLLIPSSVTSPSNVNFTATGSVFLGSSMTLDASALNTADNLIVESGTTLTLPTGGHLTVARVLDNRGSFAMQSGGSLITNGTLTNSGTMQISRTLTESLWHLISIPVAGITANTFLGDYLQSWDETTGEWENISDPFTPLNTKQGYSLWATPGKSDATYTFTGTLLTGDQSTPITYHAVSGKEFDGANLLGNPYPSSIDWDQVSGYGAVYYWDGDAVGGAAYVAYPATGGYGTGSQFVPPLQGFFILVPDNDPSSFNLTNAMRTHSGATAYYKSEKSLPDGIMLFADNGTYQDKLLIRFNNEATPNMDYESDAWKLPSNTTGISQLWSVCPDGNLSIDIRPETGIVQLGFSNDQPGIYSIGLSEMADIASAALEDTKTGTFHNLHPDSYPGGAYEFTWNPETDVETRFKLHLNSVGIEETPINETDILIYAANGQIFIKGAENGEVMVSDMMGRIVLRQEISGEEIIAIPANLHTGVYLVTVQNGNEIKTEKVLIK